MFHSFKLELKNALPSGISFELSSHLEADQLRVRFHPGKDEVIRENRKPEMTFRCRRCKESGLYLVGFFTNA